MDYFGMDDVFKKAMDISDKTEGINHTDDVYGGNTYNPIEDGPADFKNIMDNTFKTKRDL